MGNILFKTIIDTLDVYDNLKQIITSRGYSIFGSTPYKRCFIVCTESRKNNKLATIFISPDKFKNINAKHINADTLISIMSTSDLTLLGAINICVDMRGSSILTTTVNDVSSIKDIHNDKSIDNRDSIYRKVSITHSPDPYIAYFHSWGSEILENYENPTVQYTVGIIETLDGKIEMVHPTHIKFIV